MLIIVEDMHKLARAMWEHLEFAVILGSIARHYPKNSVSKYLQHCAPFNVNVNLVKMFLLFPLGTIPLKAEIHVNTEGIGDCWKRSDLKLNTGEIQSRDCRMISFGIFYFVDHTTDNTILFIAIYGLPFLTKKPSCGSSYVAFSTDGMNYLLYNISRSLKIDCGSMSYSLLLRTLAGVSFH